MPTLKEVIVDAGRAGCSVPGCTDIHNAADLYLRSVCHPKAGVQVRLSLSMRCMRVECKYCGQPVVTITP